MKIIKLSMLAAIVLTTGITSVKAQTADEILDKHIAAMGGAEMWNKVQTIKMTGSLTQQGYEINFTQTILVDKAMRQDISVMGMNGFQIVNNNEGWSYMPFGGPAKVDTMKPEMVKMYKKQTDIRGNQLIDYKSKGMKIALDGKDTINNALCYKIKFTDKDGKESTSYFDANTFYTLRSETMVKVDDQEQESAVVYGNYQKLPEGITMPMSVTAQGVEITFKSIEINKPVDEKIFKPDAVTK